jgi:histidinol-phosphate aminotransferase
MMRVPEQIMNLVPYQPGKPISETKRELGLETVHKLASNESMLPPSARVQQAVQSALQEIHRYPDGACFEMRQAIARYYGVAPEWLVFGNGSDEIVDILVQIYCRPDEAILTSQAAFSAYRISATSCLVRTIETPLRSDMRFDLAAMASELQRNDRIRMVFLPNPNNPTGTYFTQSEFTHFMGVAADRDVLVVLDEAYVEFVRATDYPHGLSEQKKYANVLLLRTMSKVFGLAGLRVGLLIAPPEICQVFNRIRKPFNINSLAQVATVAALQDLEHLEKVKQLTWSGLEQLMRGLDELGIKYLPSQANFLLFDCEREAAPVFQALLREGVILRPVAPYGFPRHLRLSVGLPEENQAALLALRKVLRGG